MTPRKWQLAADVFDDAVMLPAHARGPFVDEKCSGDPELRTAVLDLLRADEQAASVRSGPYGMQALGQLMELQPGARLGPYEVLEVLGRGGMGTVYLAQRADGAFDKQVAIKVMNFGTDERRFEAERQALARLEHPHIARLLDGGLLPDGRPYVVMEYVEGVSVTEYCRTRELDLHRRIELFMCLCEAVEFSHRNLVLHADIKPGNVLVTEGGALKLLDFGIARHFSPDAQNRGVTVTSRYYTPGYASPEQQSGDRLTTATDVYSLGVLLCELLVGEGVATANIELSRGSVSGLDLPRDLRLILARCLEDVPELRLQSAGELREQLRNYLDYRPLTISKASLAKRIKLFVRRNRLASYSLLAGASGLCLAVVIALAAVVQLRAQLDAVARAQARSDAILGVLFSAFDQANPRRSKLGSVNAQQILDAALKASVELDDSYAAASAMLRLRIAQIFGSAGNYRGAYEVLEQLAAQELRGVDPALRETIERELIVQALSLGDLGAASALLDKFSGEWRIGAGHTALLRADLLERDGKLEHARSSYEAIMSGDGVDALVRREARLGKARVSANLRDPAAMHMFASLDMDYAGDEASLRAFRFRLLRDYAKAARIFEKLELATTMYEQAISLAEQIYGDSEHPVFDDLAEGLGSVHYMRGHYEAAAESYRSSIERGSRVLGSSHLAISQRRFNLALALFRIPGRRQQAIQELEGAIQSLGESYRFSMNAAYFSLVLGEFLLAEGRCEDALDTFRRSLSIYSVQEQNSLVKERQKELKAYLSRDFDTECFGNA